MKITIISQCTGSKKYDEEIDWSQTDTKSLEMLQDKYKTLQGQFMYEGKEHKYIRSAFQKLSNMDGIDTVNWNILSGGFGIIDYKEEIPSYNASFVMSKKDMQLRAENLGIDPDLSKDRITKRIGKEKGVPKKVEELYENSDYLFLAVGQDYMPLVRGALQNDGEWKDKVIILGNIDRDELNATEIELKGLQLYQASKTIKDGKELKQVIKKGKLNEYARENKEQSLTDF